MTRVDLGERRDGYASAAMSGADRGRVGKERFFHACVYFDLGIAIDAEILGGFGWLLGLATSLGCH